MNKPKLVKVDAKGHDCGDDMCPSCYNEGRNDGILEYRKYLSSIGSLLDVGEVDK